MDDNSPTSQRRLITMQRRAEALRLRIGGATYAMIGEKLQITRQSAHSLVKKSLEEHKKKEAESVEQLRTLELKRLEVAQVAIWEHVLSGDLLVIDRLLRIMERRAKLMGLDVPAMNNNLNLDLNNLSEHQLRRLANGDDILSVLTDKS